VGTEWSDHGQILRSELAACIRAARLIIYAGSCGTASRSVDGFAEIGPAAVGTRTGSGFGSFLVPAVIEDARLIQSEFSHGDPRVV